MNRIKYFIKKSGGWINNILSKIEKIENDEYDFDCAVILEEAYSIVDSERYFHILHKITQQYYRDNNYFRLIEDIDSWIEETPCNNARDGLIKLKEKLQGEINEK